MARRATLLAVLALVAACRATTAPPAQRRAEGERDAAFAFALPSVAYTNNFSGTVGTEWSKRRLTLTPNGQRFLGEFANDSVTLKLTSLPTHRKLLIVVDAYVIRSWDGADTQWGPDTFMMKADGATLLNTTFSNTNALQNYPNPVGGAKLDAHASAKAFNVLGYTYWAGHEPVDATYRLYYTIDHTASSVSYQWLAKGLQDQGDESWGLDNLTVISIP